MSAGTRGWFSHELKPGDRLRHADGAVVTLDRRKTPYDDHHGLKYLPGWWVVEGGGLADLVVDAEDSLWERA